MDKFQIFNQVESKFCPITEEAKDDWNSVSTIVNASKGDVLVHIGENSKDLWFIAKGIVRAFYLKDGKKVCDWFAFENEFVVALGSFYHDKLSVHQLDFLSDAVLLKTSKLDMLKLADKYRAFDRIGRLSATETMIRLQQRLESIQFYTARERLDNLLVNHPNIYQQVSLGDIASYIGITNETLSRIRAVGQHKSAV